MTGKTYCEFFEAGVFIAHERMERTVGDGEADAGLILHPRFVGMIGFLATVVKGLEGEFEQLREDSLHVSCCRN